MSTSNPQSPPPTDAPTVAPAGAPVTAATPRASLTISKRRGVQIVALCVLLALAGSIGYLLHRPPAPSPADSQVPPFIPLPAHANLTRLETFFIDHVHNWYYAVSQLSEDEGLAFYQAQLPQKGWQCVTWMKNTQMSLYGQALAGTGVYITALRGTTKAQLYLGDQEYGAWLLQDELPDGNIALKVSLEPAENAPCSSGA